MLTDYVEELLVILYVTNFKELSQPHLFLLKGRRDEPD